MIARTAEQIKSAILRDASLPPDRDLDRGKKGAIIGAINKAVGGNDNRHSLLEWLFGVSSTKKLTESQWVALWKWVDFWIDDVNQWHTRSEFETEAMVCLGETVDVIPVDLPEGTFKTIMDFLNGNYEL